MMEMVELLRQMVRELLCRLRIIFQQLYKDSCERQIRLIRYDEMNEGDGCFLERISSKLSNNS